MRAWRKHLIVIVAYTVVAVVMTYPLALNFASALPGLEGDAASFVWALGWAKTALADLRVNPFHSDYVFYPLGGATQLLWAVSLIAFISIPLQYLFGLIAAHNLLYLAATVLTAYGTFLLADDLLANSRFKIQNSKSDSSPLPPFATFLVAKYVIESRKLVTRPSSLAPFTAGLVFAFAPLRLGYGLSFFNLFNTQLIPFYVFFLLRALRAQSWRNALVAGMLLGLNAYIDFQIAAFLALFSGLYALFVLVVNLGRTNYPDAKTQRSLPRVLRVFVPVWFTVGIAALVTAAPLLAFVADDFSAEGGNYIRVFPVKYSTERSYDLLSFFAPHAWSALYAGTPKIAGVNAGTHADDVSARSPDRQAFVGYLAVALAAYATLRRWRAARFWFFATLAFALFSLGPSLHVLGRDTGIPLPYLALHEIPIVNHIRIPMRYGVMVSFALAILVAIAVDDLQKRIAHSALGFTFYALRFTLLLIPLAILFESAILPYPLQPLPIPRIYADIARVPGDFTVLEIPTFNWRGAAAAEVYQPIHGKRILRVYTNRIAPGPAEYFAYRGTPIVVRSLRVLEGAEPGELAPEDIAEDKRARDDVVRFFDLRYAIVHRSYLKPAELRALDVYLREVLNARLLSDDGGTIGYAIPRAAQSAGALKIDLRESIGQMYAGRGWQFEYPPANWDGKFNFVWTRGARSEIYFVADDSQTSRAMTINANADPPQRVGIVLNGERVGEIELSSEWKDYRVTLPARTLRAGMNRVQLQYGAELKETIGVTAIKIE